ncbi:hypothetical protein V2J09_019072, partial [Rumex salicifolius]
FPPSTDYNISTSSPIRSFVPHFAIFTTATLTTRLHPILRRSSLNPIPKPSPHLVNFNVVGHETCSSLATDRNCMSSSIRQHSRGVCYPYPSSIRVPFPSISTHLSTRRRKLFAEFMKKENEAHEEGKFGSLRHRSTRSLLDKDGEGKFLCDEVLGTTSVVKKVVSAPAVAKKSAMKVESNKSSSDYASSEDEASNLHFNVFGYYIFVSKFSSKFFL